MSWTSAQADEARRNGATVETQWNGFGEVSVLIAGVEVYLWQDGGHNDEAWCRNRALRAFAERLAEVLREDGPR